MQENQLLDVLTREGVLINVSVRYWRATKKLKAEDLGLDPDDVTDRLISLGHKKLLPKEALQPFALIEGRAHALIEASSFPFLNGLGHFLPNVKLEEVTSRLNHLEQRFFEAKAAFLDRYGEIRFDAMDEWRRAGARLGTDVDHLLATIEASFPSPEKVERHYRFQTTLFQIRVPESARLDPVTMKEHQDVLQARELAVRHAQAQIAEGVEQFVSDCVATLREQVAALCDDMLESMQTGKTGVHQKTLNRLVRYIDEFKSLNFAGDRELEERLEQVRQEFLSRTAEEYRDDGYARERLQNGLKSLADTARDMAARDAREVVERFGQLGRRKFHLVA